MRTALALLLAFALIGLDSVRAQRTAASVLAELDLEQKAGQLFMSWILSRADGQDDARAALRTAIRDVGLGGVILSLGSTDDAAALVADLQEAAPDGIPLLVAADFEGSVAYRLDGATALGNNMLLGAGNSLQLAEAAGRVTGLEARALGFHWCFGPVLDVNSNPANPIINVRSFGEDPTAVGRLGVAWLRGVHDAGVLTTGKHFPGHGDVDSDSHLELPTVPGDEARLRRVELAPFEAAIRSGALDAIMTGHLAVPGLGEEPDVPATLSKRILGGLLRQELGFDGLVVTDALDMGGVRGAVPPAEVAVRALSAGADVLLMPPDPAAARDAVVEAVRNGRVSVQRLDEAVLRILTAKERLGLLRGQRTAPAADWSERVGTPSARTLADRIAERGLTLVRDRLGLVPLPERVQNPTLILLYDEETEYDETPFEATLVRTGALRGAKVLTLHPKSDPMWIRRAARLVTATDLTVVGAFVKVRSSAAEGPVLPAAFAPLLEGLRRARRVALVSFGSPYLLRDLPDVSTYVCAYDGTAAVQQAAARALHGELALTGRLPVRIPDQAEAGHGLTALPSPTAAPLPRVAPTDEGFAADLTERITAILTAGVEARAFPGAVAMISRRGRVVADVAVGRETFGPAAPKLTSAARFDLASLTKVCATTPTALALVADGKLGLDDRVASMVPGFSGGAKDDVTVRHLLTHSSGLAPFHRWFFDHEGKDAYLELAANEALRSTPGERYAYSDIGMMLLMACIEAKGGASLETLARERVFEPLGMSTAAFAIGNRPLDAVPTERCTFRKRLVRGVVHDENAYQMGGVSGHAGLFGTADDVTRLGIAFLGSGSWLPAPILREATRPAGLPAGSRRGLGWDTFRPGSSGGSKLSPQSFGHTGFTGTSMWCDPERALTIVLLSNRVHPTRDNKGHVRVRRELADAVVDALTDG